MGTEFLRERICAVLSEFLPNSLTEIWKNFLSLLKILSAKLDPFRPLLFMNEINRAAFEGLFYIWLFGSLVNDYKMTSYFLMNQLTA